MLATTVSPTDDPLAAYATGQSWHVFRGSEQDVLDRYYQAARWADCAGSDIIVRVTGDDILADPEIVDRVVDLLLADRNGAVHASNNRTARFPYGADVEAFTFGALEQAWREAGQGEEREHVTPFIRNHPERFPYAELTSPEDLSHIRLSIDYLEDLEFNRALFERLYQEMQPPFHLHDVVRCIERYELRYPAAARVGR